MYIYDISNIHSCYCLIKTKYHHPGTTYELKWLSPVIR